MSKETNKYLIPSPFYLVLINVLEREVMSNVSLLFKTGG